MPFADSTRHEPAMNALWEPKILIEDTTSGVLRENFYVCGKHLDACENTALDLSVDLYPDDTTSFLGDYERVYRLSGIGSTETRQNRIVTAHRARGGLTEAYYENLGNTLGDGSYTVNFSDGTGGIPFIIHTYSSLSSPRGPATLLPGQLYEEATGTTPWHLKVDVSGVSGPEQDLEDMLNRLKPAHCDMTFVYTI